MSTLMTTAVMLTATAAATLAIPTDNPAAWTSSSYRHIDANSVSTEQGIMHIGVNRSASPLAYKLDQPTRISGFTVKARWAGALDIPAGKTQGEEGADDFVLKLGLVETGDQTLNWFQRRVAPDWVKTLFKLAPKGSGVGRIHFYSTTQQEGLLGSSRTHPLNDLLYETRIRYLDAPGEFELSQQLAEPVEIHGLWLSADGDGTASTFDVFIRSIELETE